MAERAPEASAPPRESVAMESEDFVAGFEFVMEESELERGVTAREEFLEAKRC